MKRVPSLLFIAMSLFCVSCADSRREAEKAKEESAAKARAEAAKKEMEALPKAFSTPDYYKKNEPAKAQDKETKAK